MLEPQTPLAMSLRSSARMYAIEAGQPRVGRLWVVKADPSLELWLRKMLVHPAGNTLLVVFSIAA